MVYGDRYFCDCSSERTKFGYLENKMSYVYTYIYTYVYVDK